MFFFTVAENIENISKSGLCAVYGTRIVLRTTFLFNVFNLELQDRQLKRLHDSVTESPCCWLTFVRNVRAPPIPKTAELVKSSVSAFGDVLGSVRLLLSICQIRIHADCSGCMWGLHSEPANKAEKRARYLK